MGPQNPNFRTTALEAFWEVQERLSQDRTPSRAQWDRLFSDPGYTTLFRNDPAFRSDLLREKFVLAYRPSRRQERQRALREGADRLLSHYVSVGARRREITAFLEDWSRRDITGEARAAAGRFLPTRLLPRIADPPVSFIVFKSDAKGFSRVLMDPLGCLERPDPVLFLAHEYHHFFRRKLFERQHRGHPVRRGEPVLRILGSVESEGVADLINRSALFHRPGPTRPADRDYVQWVSQAPELLKIVDGTLSICAAMPEWQGWLAGSLMNLLPDGGHQLGFYMARGILQRLGKEQLLRCVGDPALFFTTYQRAARVPGSSLPRFSSRAVQFLRAL